MQPVADVVLTVASNNIAATTDKAQLVFTKANWNTAQMLKVTAVDDDNLVGETLNITLAVDDASSDDTFDGVATQTVAVTVADNDSAGFVLSATELTIAEGDSGTFTARLNAQPVSNVVLTVASNNNVATKIDKTQLVFTKANWKVAQTVKVIAVEDDNLVGETLNITLAVDDASGDDAFDGIAVQTVAVTVADNDSAGFVLSETGLTIAEGGSGAFTAKLNAQPVSDVVLTVVSSDTAIATIDKAQLIFTNENWNMAQIVKLTTVEDDNLVGERLNITLAVDDASSDDAFDGIAAQTVAVTVADNDNAGFTRTPEVLTVVEGSTKTFVVVLKTQPSSNVVLTVVSSDNAVATVSTGSLTFTSTDWNKAQTVTVTSVDNDAVGDDSATIRVSVNKTIDGRDSAFDDLAEQLVKVVILDQDDRVLSPEEITIPEDDKKAAEVIETAGDGLSALIAKVDEADPESGYQVVEDQLPADVVKITSGPDHVQLLGDKDGLVEVDGKPGVEVLISTDGDKIPDVVWNPDEQTLESINIKITEVVGSSQDVGEFVGYPLGIEGKSLSGATSKLPLAGTSNDANHAVTIWAYSGGELVAVTRPVLSAATPDENGLYPWQVTVADYIKPLDLGSNMVVVKGSISLPMPVTVTETLKLTKSTNRKRAEVGSLVTYAIVVENKADIEVANVAINDTLPEGFEYVEGSARWDHDANTDTDMIQVPEIVLNDGRVVQFTLGDIDKSSLNRSLRYQLRVGSGVTLGVHTNKAVAVNNNATPLKISDDILLSATGSADIEVVRDALFSLSTVVGKVYNDVNGNGWQDAEDYPIPHASLVTSAGHQVRVDADGQYHLGNVRPGRMVIRIDERSLPEGAEVIGHSSQVVDVRPGLPVKVNFGVRLSSAEIARESIKIQPLHDRLKPRLNTGAFGSVKYDAESGKFLEPLEMRNYSNYPTFIKNWRIAITEDASQQVVKTFSGDRLDLFLPVFWDGQTDSGKRLDPELSYSMTLRVTDNRSRKASTSSQKLVIRKSSGKFDGDAPAGNRDQRDYEEWLDQLSTEDKTADQGIRIVGKAVRVSGVRFSALRVIRDQQVLIEVPYYGRRQTSLVDRVRAIDASFEAKIELILPPSKVSIKVLREQTVSKEQPSRDKSAVDSDSAVSMIRIRSWFGQAIGVFVTKAYANDVDLLENQRDSDLNSPSVAESFGSLFSLDNQILLAGGYHEQADQEVKKADIYSPSSDCQLPNVVVALSNNNHAEKADSLSYTIQILSSQSQEEIEKFIEQYALDPNELQIVTAVDKQHACFGLIYGRYSDAKAARKGSMDLPADILNHGIWVRSLQFDRRAHKVEQMVAKEILVEQNLPKPSVCT